MKAIAYIEKWIVQLSRNRIGSYVVEYIFTVDIELLIIIYFVSCIIVNALL